MPDRRSAPAFASAATLTSLLRVAVSAVTLALAACGGVTNPQVIARDQATTASCDWYQMCGQIGAGLMYETRDSCETQVRAHWDQTWPPAECDSKINQSQLSVCLDAIHATQCANLLDILATLGVKCPESTICSGP